MNGMMKRLIVGMVFCGVLAGSAVLAQDNSAALEDRRAPVVLRPFEKTRILNDMREYLKGLQDIISALTREDMVAVEVRARALGTINIYETSLMFPTVSGVKFRELSALVHEEFDSIADDAKKGKGSKVILAQLALTMKRCTSCHESFRLTEMAHSR